MIKCKCGSIQMVFQKNRTHKGLYCSKCNSWIKWVNDRDLLSLARNNQLEYSKMHPKAIKYVEDLQGWW
jgi:hypothetical protein